MSVLEELQQATADVVASAGPAVVGLRFGWRPASGVVIATDRVLTCAHSVRGDEVAVTFADGRRAQGRPVALDVPGDLAVVAVETGGAPAIAWHDGEPQLGTPVFALARLGDGGLRERPGRSRSAARSAATGPAHRRLFRVHRRGGPRVGRAALLVAADGSLVGLNAVRLDGGLVLALAADPDLHERALALARGEAPARRSLGIGVVSSPCGPADAACSGPRRARRPARARGAGGRGGRRCRGRAGRSDRDGRRNARRVGRRPLRGPGRPRRRAPLALGLVRGEAEREVEIVPAEA